MARMCDISGRKTSFGGNRKHRRGSSGGGGAWKFKSTRTLRTWKPNLRIVRMVINGKPVRMKVSMKAYKKLKKDAATKPNFKLA